VTTTRRRRLAVLAGLVGLAVSAAVVTGCNSAGPVNLGGGGAPGIEDGGEPDDPGGNGDRPDAAYDVKVTVDASAVHVGYSLTNKAAQPMLVVNRIPAVAGAGVRYWDDRAYVTGQDNDRVQLSQRAFAWPNTDRKNWVQAPRVGVTRVAPGETVTATISVPRPFTRSQPFGDDLGYGTIALPDPAKDVVFCLGVIPSPWPLAIGMTEDDGVPTIAHGDAANDAQYLFCSDPKPLGT
jgi:hypothetical protein